MRAIEAAAGPGGVLVIPTAIRKKRTTMARVPSVRVRFTDGTSMDLPENDSVQVVTAGPEASAQEGWQPIGTGDGPAQFAKVAKARAAALKQGQRVVTLRGVLLVEGARRL